MRRNPQTIRDPKMEIMKNLSQWMCMMSLPIIREYKAAGFAKIVKDKFNMELNIIAPNVAGGGQTLYQTRSAAGELGDLVLVNTSNGKLNDLVSSGLIMDCTDLMDGKDIVENYGEAIDVTNEGLPEEGMFAFPNSVSTDAATESSEGLEPTFGPYIRWDYYKELGYPKMENLDDFWMCWRVCRSWRVRKKAARTSMQFLCSKTGMTI